MTYESILIKKRAIDRMKHLSFIKDQVDEACWEAAESIYENWGRFNGLFLTPDILQVFSRIGELHPQKPIQSDSDMIENLMRVNSCMSKEQRTGAYALRDYINHVHRAYNRVSDKPFEISHSRTAPILFRK